MRLDTTQEGLSALFFPHQDATLRYLFENTEPGSKGYGSRHLWEWVNKYLEGYGQDKISRATCINGLNALVDVGVLEYQVESCKGGSRRLYNVAMTPAEFQEYVSEQLLSKIATIFKENWHRTDY